MDTHKPLLCLKNVLDNYISKFLSAEAEIKDVLYRYVSMDMYQSLSLLLLDYRDLVEKHIYKLNNIAASEKISSVAMASSVIGAMINENEETLNKCKYQEVKDACFLAAIQNMIHFKISSYGTACTYANALEMEGIAAFFHQAVKDEKYFDERLTHLAKHEVNNYAIEPLFQPDQIIL